MMEIITGDLCEFFKSFTKRYNKITRPKQKQKTNRMSDTKDPFEGAEALIAKLRQDSPSAATIAELALRYMRAYKAVMIDSDHFRSKLELMTVNKQDLERKVKDLETKITQFEAASRPRQE
jgi:hypothetical protein